MNILDTEDNNFYNKESCYIPLLLCEISCYRECNFCIYLNKIFFLSIMTCPIYVFYIFNWHSNSALFSTSTTYLQNIYYLYSNFYRNKAMINTSVFVNRTCLFNLCFFVFRNCSNLYVI